jgi:glycosyltransferase involved in cell wall biosynthesis
MNNIDSKKPTVSVLVPVYNSQDYVEEALDSILSQSYDNIEILVADDFSTDKTREVLMKYSQNPRIRLFLNKINIGITANCNQILSAAKGKYISLFAGDDVMLPGKLEKQVLFMESNIDCSFCYHKVQVFQSETRKDMYTTPRNGRSFLSVQDVICNMGIPGGMSIMFLKDAMKEIGFDNRLQYASDWLFQIELARKGRIGFVDGVLARYRKYGVNNGKKLPAYEHEFIQVMDICESNHPELAKFCRQGRARYYVGHAFRQADIDSYRSIIGMAINCDPRYPYRIAFFLSYLPLFMLMKSRLINAYKALTNYSMNRK